MIPIPRSFHPHLKWWFQKEYVLQGQLLHCLSNALQTYTDKSKEGLSGHAGKHTSWETWSLPESKLHVNYLELKAVLLVPKGFQDLCSNKIELIATDNTTVVAYINKECGMRSLAVFFYGES